MFYGADDFETAVREIAPQDPKDISPAEKRLACSSDPSARYKSSIW